MHADSTMAVEVALSEALLNWPYFQDLSLVRAWGVHEMCGLHGDGVVGIGQGEKVQGWG